MRDARIGSLFTGYGGLDQAVQAVLGGIVAWHCDNDPAASRLLAHHYPAVPNLGDITKVDWRQVRPVDILSAGYPCQPFSAAGRQLGEDDDRYLWPEVARCVSVLGPRLVVLENVANHLVRGFPRVLGDLSGLGYDARWTVVSAADAGACHQRKRLFVVAYPQDDGLEWCRTSRQRRNGSADDGHRIAADAARDGWDEGRAEPAGVVGRPDVAECGDEATWGEYTPCIQRWERVTGRPVPPPRELNKLGGLRLNPRLNEWMMGLLDGFICTVPGLTRNDMMRLAGNGVVPQQGELALQRLLLGTQEPPAVGG